MNLIQDAIEAIMTGMDYLIEDLCPYDKEAQARTPERHINALIHILNINGDLEKPDLKHFDFVKSKDLVVVRDIPFFSMCKHHVLPFFGKAHVGYLPYEKVLGLSKVARLVEYHARKLQLQEQMGRDICDDLTGSDLNPLGCIVVIDAQHMCMQMRGAEAIGSVTTTSTISGEFEINQDLKQEFYSLIGK